MATGMSAPPGFARIRATIWAEVSIPWYLDPTARERDREPPGSDRQLEHRPGAGEPGKRVHRRLGVELGL